MSVVVTVMNMKGGVGKTTVTVHLAAATAAYRWGTSKAFRVLAIDYDPQFNLTQSLIKQPRYQELSDNNRTILSVLVDSKKDLNPYELQVPNSDVPPKVLDIVENVHRYKSGAVLDVVPSTIDLMYVALGHSNTDPKPIETRFKKFILECRKNYDLVLIDCHPAGSLFTKTSLRNSDYVLIPVIPQNYAVRGIGLMKSFIEKKSVGDSSPTPSILFNCTDRVGTSKLENDIRIDPKYSSLCMNNTLKKYKAFSDLGAGGDFVWDSKKPYSTEAARNLGAVCKEFLERIKLVEPK